MNRSRKKHADNVSDQILEAAKTLFAEKGYQDTTVRAIAQRARVNGSAVNYYFRSKEGLYEAIFLQAYGQLEPALVALLPTVHDQQSWEAALRTWLDFILALFLYDTPERDIFRRLVAQERSSPTEFGNRIFHHVVMPVVDVFRKLIRMAVPEADPETFQAIFIVLLGQCTCFIHRDPPWDELELCPTLSREQWARLLCDQILANIKARFSYQGRGV